MSQTNLTRRDLIHRTLFGAGFVGLRALATGLPIPFLASRAARAPPTRQRAPTRPRPST